MADMACVDQQDCVGGDRPQKETDSATLLAAVQPINVDNISPNVTTETSSQHQPRVESLYLPSSKLHYPVLSAPGMFTVRGSPLGGMSLSIEEPVQPTLRQRIRRRLPSRAAVVMFLACVAFWLCGFVFGVAGLFFELRARNLAKSGSLDDRKKVPRLRKVSCALSIVGIVIGSIIIIAVPCSLVKPEQYHYSYDYDYEWDSNVSPKDCQSRGYYSVQRKCYRFSSSSSCATCLARKGVYRNGNCYYNDFNCPGYRVNTNGENYYGNNDQCFTSRRPSTADECQDGAYDNGFCYFTPKPDCDGYFFACTCYAKFTTNFTEATCENIEGFYYKQGSYAYSRPGVTEVSQLIVNGTCFYNSFNCNGYYFNGQCSANRSSQYTTGTCRNIGGYMDSSTGYCYHNGFNCPYLLIYREQCYTSHRVLPTCGSCMNTGGHPAATELFRVTTAGVLCYYYSFINCTEERNYFLVLMNNYYKYENYYYAYYNHEYRLKEQFACEQNCSSAYTEQQCTELDGIYNDSYCYYTPSQCHNYTYQCECYNFRSSLSRSACNAYDGKYDSTHSLCYYNSTVCHYYIFNNACYHYRSPTGSQYSYSNCPGAFDDFNKVCYY